MEKSIPKLRVSWWVEVGHGLRCGGSIGEGDFPPRWGGEMEIFPWFLDAESKKWDYKKDKWSGIFNIFEFPLLKLCSGSIPELT